MAEIEQWADSAPIEVLRARLTEMSAVAADVRASLAGDATQQSSDPRWRGKAKGALRFIEQKVGMVRARVQMREDACKQSSDFGWKKYANWSRWHVYQALARLDDGDPIGAAVFLAACRDHKILADAPSFKGKEHESGDDPRSTVHTVFIRTERDRGRVELREAWLALIARVAALTPVRDGVCFFCEVADRRHLPDCVWVQAIALAAQPWAAAAATKITKP